MDYLRFLAYQARVIFKSRIYALTDAVNASYPVRFICSRMLSRLPWYSGFCIMAILSEDRRLLHHDLICSHIKKLHHTINNTDKIRQAVDHALTANNLPLAEKIIAAARKRGVISANVDETGIFSREVRNIYLIKGDMPAYLKCLLFSSKNKLIRNHYPEKWVPPEKVEEVLFGDESLAILTSLGPGDELAVSVLYAKLIEDERVDCTRLTITCDYRLHEIFRRTFPELKFVSTHLTRSISSAYPYRLFTELPKYRLHKLLCNRSARAIDNCQHYLLNLSLPYTYRNSVRRGEQKRRLLADETMVSSFQNRLPEGARLIGLSWRSSISSIIRDFNHLSIQQISPIFNIPGITYVNLQYDDSREEQKWVERHFPGKLISFNDIDMYNDFDSVIALMACLEAAITPPTAVAQLSAKSGCKTLLLCNNLSMARPVEPETNDHHWIGDCERIQIRGDILGDKVSMIDNLVANLTPDPK